MFVHDDFKTSYNKEAVLHFLHIMYTSLHMYIIKAKSNTVMGGTVFCASAWPRTRHGIVPVRAYSQLAS